jgi:folylpolyglutamate synthase/dihydropteroate synthase
VVLLALKFTKDAPATLKPLVKYAHTIVLTSFHDGMSLTTLRQVIKQLNPRIHIIVQKDSSAAFNVFNEQLKPQDLGIITGSLYMIGDLMKHKLIKGIF